MTVDLDGDLYEPYVALSYVWGQVNMFQALKSNIEELQRDNALKNDLFPIPCVVRDAFGLVILLNEQYLWVDCLCIVQDDEETKMAQINNMASIYANSYATIVVADGKDANHGLRGIEGEGLCRLGPFNGDRPTESHLPEG